MLRQRTYRSLLLGALLVFHSLPLMARVVEQVVAVIDGEPYTLSSFKEYAKTRMGGEGEVDGYIGRIKQQNRIGDEELAEVLKREGTTMESYRASIRGQIEKSEIINRQVRKRVNITSEDVERYYRLNP
ncbi:MAG: hypothetical protein HYY83_00965, partial [Deltaproteobacteria bacterium]|nr:hypothetical protein [Deltaproteobacteria bacterium]